MPDNQGDHWDFLASDLGASPPPKEESIQEEPESLDVDVEPDVVGKEVARFPVVLIDAAHSYSGEAFHKGHHLFGEAGSESLGDHREEQRRHETL